MFLQHPADNTRNIGKFNAPREKQVDGDLIGGAEDSRISAALFTRLDTPGGDRGI